MTDTLRKNSGLPEEQASGDERINAVEEKPIPEAQILGETENAPEEMDIAVVSKLTRARVATEVVALSISRDKMTELERCEAFVKLQSIIWSTIGSDAKLINELVGGWMEARVNVDIVLARFRKMDIRLFERFLRALERDHVYLTSHKVRMPGGDDTVLTLWLEPPTPPDWFEPDGINSSGSTSKSDGLLLAETNNKNGMDSAGETLIRNVTEGEEALYDMIEEVEIEDPDIAWSRGCKGNTYTRWLLRRKKK